MALRMWTLDLAREQCATVDAMFQFAAFSLDAGYDTLGLYLEHRFAFPSAPWAHGVWSLTPETVSRLRDEFPSLTLVPFVNLLGHMEGFLNTEYGSQFRETPFGGMQGCAKNDEFVAFCTRLLDDVVSVFDSELVHIGGDETWELAQCARCSRSTKSEIYAEHFSAMAESCVAKGRRPGLWGDMLLQHTDVLDALPRECLIFDWQYFGGLEESSPKLAQAGHGVVGCPTVHVYDAAWMHLGPSDANVRQVSRDAKEMHLEGTCLTTWECGLFGAYDTVLPAVRAARRIMDDPDGAPGLVEGYGEAEEWAREMSYGLAGLGGVFGHDGHRNRLKCRLLLYGNPFLAWRHHREEFAGEAGPQAIEVCERAARSVRDEGCKGVSTFVRSAVEFVQIAEEAHEWYAKGEPERAVKALAPARHVFDNLERVARRSFDRIGGSLADVERTKVAREHVERVIRRIQSYGRGELGYLPAFDVLTDPMFVPHDQACWWAVNKWGRD
ncbi:MAG: family 20 glycosylhydrolase [Armatimonadetes bacterium]|nr:family 20 glycosylhydrolase [Armatimonadota bacterium]